LRGAWNCTKDGEGPLYHTKKGSGNVHCRPGWGHPPPPKEGHFQPSIVPLPVNWVVEGREDDKRLEEQCRTARGWSRVGGLQGLVGPGDVWTGPGSLLPLAPT
jgi:hypothetical protein